MVEKQQEPQPQFFICPVCFTAAPNRIKCHGHDMIPCMADKIEDCKPLMTTDGQLQSRAPRWFLDGVAKLRE